MLGFYQRALRHCMLGLDVIVKMHSIWQNTSAKNPEILRVNYPFLPTHPAYNIAKNQMKMGGGIVSFELKGGLERAKKFLNNLQMLSLSANLGDTRSICYASCLKYSFKNA